MSEILRPFAQSLTSALLPLIFPSSSCSRSTMSAIIEQEDTLSIDARSAVGALLAMECKYCEQGFDGAEHSPSLAPCGHLFCDECVQWDDDSIKCHCGGKVVGDEMTECTPLKTLFENLATDAAIRCISCERLHPLDNCCRLRVDKDLERFYCVWCAVQKLGEDDDVVSLPIEGDMIAEILLKESRDGLLSSFGEQGIALMKTVVCCCLCEKRIHGHKHQRRLPDGSCTSYVQALSCGHFVCSQQCLSEKIDGHSDSMACCFCDTEIEEDGIRAEYLGDLLSTASEGQKCSSCRQYRSRRDVCTEDDQTMCVWCLVASREFVEKLIDID